VTVLSASGVPHPWPELRTPSDTPAFADTCRRDRTVAAASICVASTLRGVRPLRSKFTTWSSTRHHRAIAPALSQG
jgi:hypothetical protein